LHGHARPLAPLRSGAELVALRAAWWLFKVALSVAAVGCGTWIAYDWGTSGVPGAFIPALVVFCAGLLIAAAPWVLGYQERTPPRSKALAVIACGAIAVSVAASYMNSPYVLRSCERWWAGTRGRISCDLFNWLYSIGGNFLIVALIMAVGVLFLGAGTFLLIRIMRP
jgi:hypothetical protein